MIIPADASYGVQVALRDTDGRLKTLERGKSGVSVDDLHRAVDGLRGEIRAVTKKRTYLDPNDVFIGSGAAHAIGYVPDPGSSAGTTRFLREDGTWVAPTPAAGGGFTDDGTKVRLTTITDYVGIGNTTAVNKLVVGTDACGATATPDTAIAVGNASGDTEITLGQGTSDRGRLYWDYDATAANAVLHLRTGNGQMLTLQSGDGPINAKGRYTLWDSTSTSIYTIQDTGGPPYVNELAHSGRVHMNHYMKVTARNATKTQVSVDDTTADWLQFGHVVRLPGSTRHDGPQGAKTASFVYAPTGTHGDGINGYTSVVNWMPSHDITPSQHIIGVEVDANNYGADCSDFKYGAQSIYSTGTVSVTNGSATVTGSGTTFIGGHDGKFFKVTRDGTDAWYLIDAVGGATSITLDRNFGQASGSGLTYAIYDSFPMMVGQKVTTTGYYRNRAGYLVHCEFPDGTDHDGSGAKNLQPHCGIEITDNAFKTVGLKVGFPIHSSSRPYPLSSISSVRTVNDDNLALVSAGSADKNFLRCIDSTLANIMFIITEPGNVGIRTNDYGSGVGVLAIKNAATNPSVNPTAGGVLYADAGALKWRGSGGTTTTIAPA
jgi:hypothetical protein